VNIEEIKKYVPHRYPFLHIDRVVEIVPNERIECIKLVSYNDPIFQGHFPGNPVFPGVFQVEAMAQASAVLGRVSQPEFKDVLLTGIIETRFRSQVVPGDVLVLKVQYEKRRGKFSWFYGEALVSDKVVAYARFSARLY
jgi:3-hydroxyacyl-[acyl-carrier-protein] dehydratase